MLILALLGMYFDAVVVFVTSQTLLFRLALTILWGMTFTSKQTDLENSKTSNISQTSADVILLVPFLWQFCLKYNMYLKCPYVG